MAQGIRVRFFAQAREAVGHRELLRPVPVARSTLGELLRALGAEYPRLPRVLAQCRVAINGTYVDDRATELTNGDEIAIHPPFSGG